MWELPAAIDLHQQVETVCQLPVERALIARAITLALARALAFDECLHAQARTLLMDLIPALAESLKFTFEPITTCYLQYEPALKLPTVFYALQDDPEKHRWAQFIFDRGQLDTSQSGLMAVVISAATEAIAQGNETLLAEVLLQIASDLDMPALLNPQWHRIISEKRATFSCTPNLQRPANDTGLKGLFLAGDYTAGDYPATLEGAVRSGREAARQLLLQSSKH